LTFFCNPVQGQIFILTFVGFNLILCQVKDTPPTLLTVNKKGGETVSSEEKCCHGKYHIEIDGKFYCMAPPNYECGRSVKYVGNLQKEQRRFCTAKIINIPATNAKIKKTDRIVCRFSNSLSC